MVKLFWSFLTFGLSIVILSFVLSNRQDVVLSLWPFEVMVTCPVWVVALVSFAAGSVVVALFGMVRRITGCLSAACTGRRKETAPTQAHHPHQGAVALSPAAGAGGPRGGA